MNMLPADRRFCLLPPIGRPPMNAFANTRYIVRTATLLLPLILTACSSLQTGSSDYGCSGMPDGVRCQSARDVYAMTSEEAPGLGLESEEHIALRLVGVIARQGAHSELPPLDQSLPLRTPARVLRIWIAPWEDDQGDLNHPGYRFTEIEPRRWSVGMPAPDAVDPVLRPLQSPGAAASATAPAPRQDQSLYGEPKR